MKELWVWLAGRAGLNKQQMVALLAACGGVQALYGMGQSELEALGLSAQAVESLCDKNVRQAQLVRDYCEAQGIELLCFDDSRYPNALRNLADPPILLYCKGTLPDWNALPVIGVVGTRAATSYGQRATKTIAGDLAEGGALLVSGMAKGVDAWATEAALAKGAPAIGVLGCGIDRVYPAENRDLYRLMEKKGCLISEYPPGVPPAKWYFPQRNRIISGISNGVVVVEAPLHSGALITARQALEQGRDVFAVPNDIDSQTGAGCNQLIRSGATLVTNGWEILNEYTMLYPDKLTLRQPDPDHKEAVDEKTVDNRPAGQYSDVATNLSEQEQAVLAVMNAGRQMLDEILEKLEFPPAQVMSVLTMLSIKGLVANLPGGIVEKL